jgi:aminocarboxymuconate-semialdehyde decarboxylase
MKIDIFPHIFPKAYYERMLAMASRSAYMQKRIREIPVLSDLDVRFRIMDRYDEYVQVLTLCSPPIEALGGPKETPELARIGNDGMAELCVKHPDRFPGFVASLPMNNPEAALAELDRVLMTLGATGIQIWSNVNGRPLDEPEFAPIFERMAAANLPIWIHPARPASFADYSTETKSKYEMWWVFGWPYESSVAMSRILFAGYFDRFPDLKIIVHHLGGMIPHFAGRIGGGLDQLGTRTDDEDLTVYSRRLRRRPYDYYRMFYGDTALFGARHAVQCGIEFFGADQVLFGTDMPFDPEKGTGFIRETIRNIEEIDLSAEDRRKIYEGNARRLLRLKLA